MVNRIKWFTRIGLGLIALIIIKLFLLQIISGERYFRLAEMNRIRKVIIPAPRGKIFDRAGRVLADNRQSLSISLIATNCDSNSLLYLSQLTNVPSDEIFKRLAQNRKGKVKIKRDADLLTVQKIEENGASLPGVMVETEPTRYYPYRETFLHSVGYLGEVNKRELKTTVIPHSAGYLRFKNKKDMSNEPKYQPGDLIGRYGVEALYEHYLRGKPGLKFIEVTATGREIGPIFNKRPVPAVSGSDLYLTLDARLQDTANKLLKNYERAAIIGIDLKTGGIVLYLSKPGFDPNTLLPPIDDEEFEKLSYDKNRPFFNRVIMGAYPPGSTFKPCVAIAGLRNQTLTPNSRFSPCTGKYQFGNRVFKCWTRHGSLDLISAIAQSCNIYFYQAGLKIGLDAIINSATQFGLGRPFSLPDIGRFRLVNLPSRTFLDEKYGKNKWPRGTILNLSIGQGEILVTPLQLAIFYSAIAGNGKFYLPYLVAKIGKNGNIFYEHKSQESKVSIPQEIFVVIERALEFAVERGTGAQAQIRDSIVTIYGKTGTAENPFGEDHAWFVGYAKIRNEPQVLFAILLENAGKGGAVAAPVARELFRYYMKSQIREP